MWLILILAIPIVCIFVAKFVFHSTITNKEWAVCIAGTLLVTAVAYFAGVYYTVVDKQVLSGTVTSKEKDRVHCRHSYQVCHGSGKHRHCTTHYRHLYDIDWLVHSNIDTWRIKTVDSQGLIEPKRWTIVQKGDPVATTDYYENYIKAAQKSLFHQDVMSFEKYKGKLPEYPINVYDYYKVDRFVNLGVPKLNTRKWNDTIQLLNGITGPSKQSNLIVVMTPNPDRQFGRALNRYWLGGKKNDVVVVMGVVQQKIMWAEILSMADSSKFRIKLENELLQMNVDGTDQNMNVVLGTINKAIQKDFFRKPMKDFKYLSAEVGIDTNPWTFFWVFVLSMVVSIGQLIWFHKVDVFNEEWKNRRNW